MGWCGFVSAKNSSEDSVSLNYVNFSDNTATWGGAVYQSKGNLSVTNSVLNDNKAIYGGGFYLASGEASLIDTSISTSETTRYGTAIAKPNATKLVVKIGNQVYDEALREYVDELDDLF
jgi:hypothetical protein